MNLPSLPNLSDPLGDFAVQFAATVASGLALRGGGAKQRKRAEEKFRLRTEAHIQTLAHRVAQLATRFDDLQAAQEKINASLEEPDVWVLLEVSKTAAGFTSNELKHRALSRAVAERLVCETDSAAALASAHAVEIISKLTPAHLELLGLAALVYQIRPGDTCTGWDDAPDSSDLDLEQPEGGEEYKRRSRALYARKVGQVEQFIDWLSRELDRYTIHAPPPLTINDRLTVERDPSETTIAHLASVDAWIYDRQARRDLVEVLGPWRGSDFVATMGVKAPFDSFLWKDPSGQKLKYIWPQWMERVTPTPAGLLVGIAVHDVKAGTTTEVDLAQATYVSAGQDEDPIIWHGKGSRVSDEFLRPLDDAIRSLHQRGSTFVSRLKEEY